MKVCTFLFQLEMWISVFSVLLPLPPLVIGAPEVWPDCCVLEWGTDSLFEKVEPTEALDVLIDEDIRVETESVLDPDMSSGRKSEDEDDGARVPIDDPTGYGATGISAREEADGL